MATYLYTTGIPELKNWYSGTATVFKVALVGSGYTPNIDEATMTAAAVEEETNGSYARFTVTSPTVTVDTTNDFVKYDADDFVWASLTTDNPIVGAIVYKHVGADASNIPIAYLGFTSTTGNGTTFTIAFTSNGIITLQGA